MKRLNYKWIATETKQFFLPDYNGGEKTILSKKDHTVLAKITPDGNLTVYKGYAWDGCTPKWVIGGKVFGVWDGFITYENKQQMYYPSMVHDVLCQIYNREHGINFYTRKSIDTIFYNEMTHPSLDINVIHRCIYYTGVRVYALIKNLK